MTGVITVMPPHCVEVQATDLNLGSYDNCTPKNRLKLFDGDTSREAEHSAVMILWAAISGAGDESERRS
ncbi:MAG: hypothetical protein IPL98_19510 [Saprospiraceae bacterium]|nr:hypothetical protein [Saprospiraceae bacterium]